MPNEQRQRLFAVAITLLLVGLASYPQWQHVVAPLFGNAKDTHWTQARAHFNNKRYSKAIEECDWLLKSKQITRQDELQKVLLLQGRAYYETNNFDKAEEVLASAVDIKPNVEAYQAYGNALLKQKAYNKAVEVMDKAIKLDESNPESYCIRAHAWAFLKKWFLAAQDYGVAWNLKPTAHEYLFAYVNALDAWGDKSMALMAIEEASETGHGTADLIAMEGQLVRELFKESKDEHQRNRSDFLPYIDGAYAMLRSKWYQDAYLAANRAIELGATKIPLVYRIRGDANYHLGRYKDALADYDRALALYPESALSKRHRAWAQEKLKLNGSAK